MNVPSIPKGYKLAKNQSKSCATCGAFEKGYCKMYYVPVEAAFTCKDWVKTFKKG